MLIVLKREKSRHRRWEGGGIEGLMERGRGAGDLGESAVIGVCRLPGRCEFEPLMTCNVLTSMVLAVLHLRAVFLRG